MESKKKIEETKKMPEGEKDKVKEKEEKKKTDDYRIFEQSGRILAVYYSMNRKELKSLKKDLDKMVGEKTLYCFTLDPFGLHRHDFDGWDDIALEPIPQKILDIYEGIYEH